MLRLFRNDASRKLSISTIKLSSPFVLLTLSLVFRFRFRFKNNRWALLAGAFGLS